MLTGLGKRQLLVVILMVLWIQSCKCNKQEPLQQSGIQSPSAAQAVILRDEDNRLRLTMTLEKKEFAVGEETPVRISLEYKGSEERCLYSVKLVPDIYQEAQMPTHRASDDTWRGAFYKLYYQCYAAGDQEDELENTAGDSTWLYTELFWATHKEEVVKVVTMYTGKDFRFVDPLDITRLLPNTTVTKETILTFDKPGKYWVRCGIVSTPEMYAERFRKGLPTADQEYQIFRREISPESITAPPGIWYGILFIAQEVTVKPSQESGAEKTSSDPSLK